MSIELGDGLQFAELLEILERLNVTNLLAPELRTQLLDGVNALLAVAGLLEQFPFVRPFLPGSIGEKLTGAVQALQLVKGLLDA